MVGLGGIKYDKSRRGAFYFLSGLIVLCDEV